MNVTPGQIDILKELINIGVGRSAAMLNEMVNTRIYLQVPSVRIFSLHEANREMQGVGSNRLASVELLFKGPFSGSSALFFSIESASNPVAVLTGEEIGTPDLDSVMAGTISEVGNILVNGVMGSIGNVLKVRITYSLPRYAEDSIRNLLAPRMMLIPTPQSSWFGRVSRSGNFRLKEISFYFSMSVPSRSF